MNDPHVETLTYVLYQDDTIEYAAPALTFSTAVFTGELSGTSLIIRPLHHFASPEDVRPVIEPFLAAWRIDAGLKHGRDDFRFSFASANVVDRNPTPGTNSVHLSATIGARGDVHLKVSRKEYPSPPVGFQVTPEVEVLWDRFNAYLAQREPLLSMAYFCLTLLERGDRKAAAKHYNIDFPLLNKLGEITSTRGDNHTARKATATKRLSPQERTWIEEAIKAIIRHIAEGRSTTLLRSSLPPI